MPEHAHTWALPWFDCTEDKCTHRGVCVYAKRAVICGPSKNAKEFVPYLAIEIVESDILGRYQQAVCRDWKSSGS